MVIQQEEGRAREQQEASYGIRYRTGPAGVGQLGVADLVGYGHGGCGTPICGNRYRRAVGVSHEEAAAVHRGRHIARNWLTGIIQLVDVIGSAKGQVCKLRCPALRRDRVVV